MLDQLKGDLNVAMKARDTVKVRVLRMVLSDLHNRKIATGKDLADEEVVAALRTAVKQRHEAAEQYVAGGRQDRADAELEEIAVIETYLPELLEGDALAAAVDAAIVAAAATSPADMGKVMGLLMAEHQGRIDGKSASALVRQRLAAL